MECTKFKQEPSGIGLSATLVWAREYHMISGKGGAHIFFPGWRCHSLYKHLTTLKTGTPSPPLKLEGSETAINRTSPFIGYTPG